MKCNKMIETKKPFAHNVFKGDYESMRKDLKYLNWEYILSGNIDEATNIFVSKMKEVLTAHAPRIRNSSRSKNIFMTSRCLKIKGLDQI